MNLIVAVDERWGIGREGNLLASLPGDMAYFKEMTMDKVVVMGRKTLESLPGKRGLPHRVNYVITRNAEFNAERCVVLHDDEEISCALGKHDADDIFIIGGESIYRKFYKECKECYVTKIDADLGADRFMPDLDADSDFRLVRQGRLNSENGIDYRFCVYRNMRTD